MTSGEWEDEARSKPMPGVLRDDGATTRTKAEPQPDRKWPAAMQAALYFNRKRRRSQSS